MESLNITIATIILSLLLALALGEGCLGTLGPSYFCKQQGYLYGTIIFLSNELDLLRPKTRSILAKHWTTLSLNCIKLTLEGRSSWIHLIKIFPPTPPFMSMLISTLALTPWGDASNSPVKTSSYYLGELIIISIKGFVYLVYRSSLIQSLLTLCYVRPLLILATTMSSYTAKVHEKNLVVKMQMS